MPSQKFPLVVENIGESCVLNRPTQLTSWPSLLHYIFASLLRSFLRRPRRVHLRRCRPIRPRSAIRLMPHAPHRRRKPSARRHRVPSRTRVTHILPLAQEIQHERNRREQQQQIHKRTGREVYCVVKNPGQQQDHSYDDEHGVSNHSWSRRSNNPLVPKSFESRRVSTFAGPEEILRRAALCSDRCLAGNTSARNPGRDVRIINGGPRGVRIVRNRQIFGTACIGLPLHPINARCSEVAQALLPVRFLKR
jgi:hypothetical protein